MDYEGEGKLGLDQLHEWSVGQFIGIRIKVLRTAERRKIAEHVDY